MSVYVHMHPKHWMVIRFLGWAVMIRTTLTYAVSFYGACRKCVFAQTQIHRDEFMPKGASYHSILDNITYVCFVKSHR